MENITIGASLVGLLLMLMGLLAIVRPFSIVRFFGVDAKTKDFRNEIRAVYGGFGIATGFLLIIADNHALNSFRQGIYIAYSVALFGMAFGRIISTLIERPGKWPVIFMSIEIVGGLILILSI